MTDKRRAQELEGEQVSGTDKQQVKIEEFKKVVKRSQGQQYSG